MTSAERREARFQRRKAKREEARLKRSRECGDFEEVFSFRHLYLSGKKCCKGVYWKNSTQRYIGNLIANTAKTRRELLTGTFRHRGFHQFDLVERGNSFKVLESTDHYFKSIFGFYPDKKGWSVHV